MYLLETDAKKLAQKLANNKNSRIISNQTDIQAICPTHNLVIFTKFFKDLGFVKNCGFSVIFFASVSKVSKPNMVHH